MRSKKKMKTAMQIFTPKHRKSFAKILLVICLIGWPLSASTIFKDEPQGILGLSWLALILTSIDILFTSSIEK